MQSLIADGEAVDAVDHRGFTPLHFACQQHDIEVATALLSAGAPADPQDKYGNTPLWRLVFGNRATDLGLVRDLLAAGADPNLKNFYDNSPRDVALKFVKHDVVSLFGPGPPAPETARQPLDLDELAASLEPDLARWRTEATVDLLARRDECSTDPGGVTTDRSQFDVPTFLRIRVSPEGSFETTISLWSSGAMTIEIFSNGEAVAAGPLFDDVAAARAEIVMQMDNCIRASRA